MRVVGFCVCWCEAVEIFVGFVCSVELILIDSLRLQASGFRLRAFLCLRFATALACSNSVFVVFRQRQSEWVNVKFVATGASGMELQFFRFFESF